MTNLERAIKDGYAHIIGEKGKEKITYVSSDNHVENYSDPEEKVRAEFWAELIYKYEYPVNRIKIEVTVPDRLPTDRADIVVFRDDECKRPYAVVECKNYILSTVGQTLLERASSGQVQQKITTQDIADLKVNPTAPKVPDGHTAMNMVFSDNAPLLEFCDRSTETGSNIQKGYMQMLAGAMSALRNPTSNIDGISFKKIRKVNNGYLYEISIPYEKKLIDEEKPFRRVDGNHRLQAMEQLVSTGQISSTYLIPFCLILFADTDSLKDEKVIFHNINSKAVPLKSEQLLKSVLIQQHDGLDFNDRELIEKFGPEYLLARKILSANPLIVRKLGYIEWIHPRILSTLVDLINYVQEKSGTRIETLEQQEALINSLNNTLRHAHPLGAATLQMASGLLFLLVYMYYQMENGELDPQNKAEKEKNQLIAWAEKYNITDAQHDIEQYAAVNADCIRAIFDKYVLSTEQTIFMSRCFDSRFDENERAIRRAIECVNREKGSSLRLLRVDQHSEGATGQISDRILRDIEMSGLVIADLSSGRANIPHEIGFAMGLKKGLILIHNGTDAEADEHTPSNIKMYEQIRFNQDYHKLETELKAKLIDYYKL